MNLLVPIGRKAWSDMEYEKAKFKALVHYIVWRAGDRPGFGATKLNKVLWFSDARMYMLTGQSITGATYIRQKFGPTPQQIMSVRAELEQEGMIKFWSDRFFNKPITRFRAEREPSGLPFTTDEIQIVDWWIDHITNDHTAGSISEQSHDYGWEIYQLGEVLPYRAFLASRVREELLPTDRRWAERRAKELGLP